MSVDYIVHPVDHDMIRHGIQYGVRLPPALPHGRFPTPEELITILGSIPLHAITNQSIGPSGEIDITIESVSRISIQPPPPFTKTTCAETYLHATGTISEFTTRPWLSFHGDFDLMVEVIRQLTDVCGPQVFFECGDAIPWFVLSPTDELVGPPV